MSDMTSWKITATVALGSVLQLLTWTWRGKDPVNRTKSLRANQIIALMLSYSRLHIGTMAIFSLWLGEYMDGEGWIACGYQICEYSNEAMGKKKQALLTRRVRGKGKKLILNIAL